MSNYDPISTRELDRLFPGDSELAHRMRNLDWLNTDLGSPENWPENLRVAVSLCLTSRIPIVIYWGPRFTVLYNDPYISFLGDAKHPRYLGQPGYECWGEIWDTIGPMLNGVHENGEATWSEDLLMFFSRKLPREEVYVRFTFGPILASDGKTVEGIFCPCTETTEQVIGARRLETLRKLSIGVSEMRTSAAACEMGAEVLAENPQDIPFAAIYIIDETGEAAKMCASCGLDEEKHHTLPSSLLSTKGDGLHALLASVLQSHRPQEIFDLYNFDRAIALPIPSLNIDNLAGLLVVGISSQLVWDERYETFCSLVANHIGTAIANAEAYETERIRAEKLAELDYAKTTFFNNISHEFRTPLMLMLSPLEEILTAPSDQPLANHHQELELVHRNGIRLLKLVNALLDFSRVEAGRLQALYEPTDLVQLTRELSSVFRSAIVQAGLTLTVNCSVLPEPVYVDRAMWEKILLNLLSNAFKFTFEGEITVSLCCTGKQIVLAVQDTGIGIPEAELPNLFQRFHRVKDSRGRTFEGSGIGLSLVKELVCLHGGTINVTSTLGEGSCFSISIPTGYAHLPPGQIGKSHTLDLTSTVLRAASHVQEAFSWLPDEKRQESSFSSVDAESAPQASSLSSYRILLVDDNADMRNYIERLLNKHYQVESSSNGLEALASIRQQMPDLVLTDVMMPELDGFSLLRELRADPKTRRIPVILLSAQAEEKSSLEGLGAGADDYLVKPFSARELLARVEGNLKMAKMRQTAFVREQALRMEAEFANEQLENIMSRIDDQFMALDRDWRYIYVNDRVSQVLGKPREEFLGNNIWEMFPNTVNTRFYTEVQRAMTEQVFVIFEYFYPSWQRWFEIRVYPSTNGVSILIAEITDRKQAELQLQQSQYFNQQITETLPGIVFVYDLLEQRNVYVNGKVAELLGYTVEEVQGIGTDLIFAWTHPEDLERLLTYLDAFRWMPEEAIAIREIEYRCLHANGEWRWIFIRSLVFNRAEDDTPRQILGVVLDISARKQAEEALREREVALDLSNKRFEQAAMAVNCLIYEWDVQQDYVIRTEGLTRILGYSLEKAKPTGEWWRSLIHPEDFPRVQAEAVVQFENGTRYCAEYRVLHKNNYYVHVQDQGILSKDAQGNWLRIIGSTIDISERKQAEARLLEQELFLKDLTNNVPVMLWTTQLDGMINYISQSWINYMGVDLHFLRREGWRDLIHPDDFEETWNSWNYAIQTGEPYEFTHRLRRQDGEYHWFISRARLTYDDQLNPLRWVGSAVDIEGQKQTELTLMQTTELLKKSNEELNRFAYVVSHDLKAPLRAIANLSQWLEEDLRGQLREENQLQIKLLLQRVHRMERLIDGLLAYSRADRSNSEAESVDVNLLINEIIDSLVPPPNFIIAVQSRIPRIVTRRILLAQVFTNLISNAIKHHERPDGRIGISARTLGNFYEFEVSDDGPGIDPKYHNKIFEIFQTLKSKDLQENTGIGLSIVKKIIEAEGGKIRVESAEGKGTTFCFTWPSRVNT